MIDIKNRQLFIQRAYIGGEWVKGKDSISVDNPATGEVIGHVPALGTMETKHAIAFASEAFKAWSARTAKERAGFLRRWFDLIIENGKDLALILTTEQGKPLAEAMGEVKYAASFIEWFAEEAKRADGSIIATHNPNARVLALKQPVGVVAAITPWNFPLAMITRKIAPALAVGCTTVLKPSELTPFSALALTYLAECAGIPGGVINCVTGLPEDIGETLATHKAIRKLTFTGSTRVGQLLANKTSETLKKLSLELGGNAPFMVFDDANLEDAVNGLMASKFRNAGQTCVCANRVYLHDNIYDEFLELLTLKTRSLKVGDGRDPETDMGPLINGLAVEKVERHIEDAVANGGKVIVGGGRHALGGNFVQATIISNVAPESLLCREETFGPVCGLVRFSADEEVLEYANNSDFGLAAYFYTKDLSRAWRISEKLETGIVGVNEGIISAENAPFGGVKQSGFGREGSRFGMDDYLEIKYVLMGGV